MSVLSEKAGAVAQDVSQEAVEPAEVVAILAERAEEEEDLTGRQEATLAYVTVLIFLT